MRRPRKWRPRSARSWRNWASPTLTPPIPLTLGRTPDHVSRRRPGPVRRPYPRPARAAARPDLAVDPHRPGPGGRCGNSPGPSAVRPAVRPVGLSAADDPVRAVGHDARRLLDGLAGGLRLFLHRLLVGGGSLFRQSRTGLDGALRRQPAARRDRPVLGGRLRPLSPARTRRGGPGPAVRRPVLRRRMAARPLADRLSLEPGGRDLAGGRRHVAVRFGGRRLWAELGHGRRDSGPGALDRPRRGAQPSDLGRTGRPGPGFGGRLWRPAA